MFGAGGGIRTPEGIKPFDLQSNAFGRFATPACHCILPDVRSGLQMYVEPPVGIEPTTFTLQKCCSTAELRWRLYFFKVFQSSPIPAISSIEIFVCGCE